MYTYIHIYIYILYTCIAYILYTCIYILYTYMYCLQIIPRVVLAWNIRGVFAGTLLEITSPLMPFENFDFTFTQ